MQSTTTQQASSNFNVSGDSIIGGNMGISMSNSLTRLRISPSTIEFKLTLYDSSDISAGQLNYQSTITTTPGACTALDIELHYQV